MAIYPATGTTRRWIMLVSGGLLVGWALAGCGGDDVYLPALRADTMASWVPTGGRLAQSSEAEYDPGSGSRKPRQARVQRTFSFASDVEVRSAVAEALTRASAAGWSADPLGRRGFLTRSGPRSSTITFSALPSALSATEIVVTLTAP